MNIILIGIQGSGKGTQARKVMESYSQYSFFEMGQKLREYSLLQEEFSAQVKINLAAGELVSPNIIEAMLEYTSRTQKDMILFDGVPRTLEQINMVEKYYSEYIVIFLDLPKEVALERIAGRRMDPSNGITFPVSFEGEFSPFTGEKLVTREDDTPEAALKRISAFYHNTLPLLAEWASRGKRVYRIDASKSIEEVWGSIQVILSAY